MNSYRELIVYRKSIDLVSRIYRCTKAFPRSEQFGLTGQMRRAAVSIPSNIAEGNASAYRMSYLRHLSIARGSAAELDTQIVLALRLGYLHQSEADHLSALVGEIGKMTTSIMRKLEKQS